MQGLIYSEFVRFYRLLDPLEDHAAEGEVYAALLKAAVPDARSLLELGSGAGNGAFYMKSHFDACTLSDLSPEMLGLSRDINPECTHVEGDMRILRLGQTFDCVWAHDAIVYMLTPDDLLRAATTAFVHTRPGGAALFVPDCVQESFKEFHEDHAGDDGDLGLRAIAWSWDPDPTDTTHVYDFAFLLREGNEVRAVHDRHVAGLFGTETWLDVLTKAGFEVDIAKRPLPPEYQDGPFTDQMFVGRRPV